MKWNFKGLGNTKQLAMAGVTLALMFIFGMFFEGFFNGLWMGTRVNPSPIEGLIIIPLFIMGIFPALVIAVLYVLMIALFKGTTTNYIGEVALMIALITYIFSTVLGNAISRPLAKHGHLKRGIVTMSCATLITTSVMIIMNLLFISPSFANGLKWTTIFTVFGGDFSANLKAFIPYIAKPVPVGVGIIHGNIVKYLFASAVALVLLKSSILWKLKASFERKSTLN